MRLLKGFVFAVSGLFIVITLMSLLMPSKVMTARSVTIAASPKTVMDQLTQLNNWKNWHPIFKKEILIVISDPSSGKGAFAEWVSNSKKNQLQITNVSSVSVQVKLKRTGEKDMLNDIKLTQFKDSNSVQVEWLALTSLKWYPWEKFSGIFIDKMTGPGYEAALNGLRDYLESADTARK